MYTRMSAEKRQSSPRSLGNEINVICDRHKWERGTRKTALYIALREFQPSSIKSELVSDLMNSVSMLDGSGQSASVGGFCVCNALPGGDGALDISRSTSFGPAYSGSGNRLSTDELKLMPQLKAKRFCAMKQWLSGGLRVWLVHQWGQHSLLMAATTFPLASSWQLSVRTFPVAFFSSAIENVSQASGRGRQRPGWICAGIRPF